MAFGLWNWLFILFSLIGIVYFYLWKKNQYFKDRQINFVPPHVLFGNMFKIYFGIEHMYQFIEKLYWDYSKDRYVGAFNFTSPVVILKDPEIIKQVAVQNFESFVDHMPFTDKVSDPLMGRSLFSLSGEEWKEMRSTLSPAFTSSKMRTMFSFMGDCAQNLVSFIEKETNHPEAKQKGYAELEIKDPYTRSANDIIASCGFGVTIDSLKERDNKFYRMTKDLTQFTAIGLLKTIIFFVCPILMRILKIELTSKNVSSFFRELVTGNMKTRTEKKIIRPDMIHLMMLAKQGNLQDEPSTVDAAKDMGFAVVKEQFTRKVKKTEWTNDDVTAQVMLFLFAGFETTSTLLSFATYELAINPDIQEKLHDEVISILQEKDGNIEYNDLSKLTYLDMVISETLRMWPGVVNLDRMCVKATEFLPQNDYSGIKHMVHKGDTIWIPTYSIHRDPKYFENPNTFDPERFSEERKLCIQPFTYFPFGVGPRACIGSRFALMEAKILLFHMIANFEFIQTSRTPVPMKLKNHIFEMVAENGFWMGVKSRT